MSFHSNSGGRYAVFFQFMSSEPVITDDLAKTLREMDMSTGNVAHVWPVDGYVTTAASLCMTFVAVPTGDSIGYSWVYSIAKESR